jgi:alkanesulfonate monooxygenase SsuD/methylene tetrahydromethanopterin reductase-like flavin-dependent oxidoreductase (luciferase family)
VSKPVKQIHLAAHFPGVNNTTVWSDPRSGSHIEFSSFAHLARTAERAKFDFLFLAEGLRLREQNGQIYDLDVVGRPDTFTVLAALAAVTSRLGLAGTINSTFNEPYEVARQFASLDHLSGGRAAWNVVTSWDAFTGENFRRGGFLPQTPGTSGPGPSSRPPASCSIPGLPARSSPTRSMAFSSPTATRGLSPTGMRISTSAATSTSRAARRVARSSSRPATPTRAASSPRPVLMRSSAGTASSRTARPSTPDQLLILPAATFVLGGTDAQAQERAREVRLAQVSGQTAIKFAEQLWNRDLSGYDPDGPLPDIDPDPGENTIARGRASVRMYRDPVATAQQWRAQAAAQGLSIRELIIEVTGRQSFIGSPATVAATINRFVQADASDGFILVPHITPGGLDEFADTVVPLLQERGVFRADYTGSTLREHLGLAPARTVSSAGSPT